MIAATCHRHHRGRRARPRRHGVAPGAAVVGPHFGGPARVLRKAMIVSRSQRFVRGPTTMGGGSTFSRILRRSVRGWMPSIWASSAGVRYVWSFLGRPAAPVGDLPRRGVGGGPSGATGFGAGGSVAGLSVGPG